MLTNVNKPSLQFQSQVQFTHTSRSSHSWLSKQPQLVQSSKLLVASLSCAELGTAQPKLVSSHVHSTYQHSLHELYDLYISSSWAWASLHLKVIFIFSAIMMSFWSFWYFGQLPFKATFTFRRTRTSSSITWNFADKFTD